MKKESTMALLDNGAMLTENILKTSFVDFTGRVRFNSIKRTDQRSPNRYAYVISFEVITNDQKEFYDLYSKRNNLKEFANLNSVEKYLKKIGFLQNNFILSGEILREEGNAN